MEPNAPKSAASLLPAEIRAYLVDDPDLMIDPSSPPASDQRPASQAAETAGCPMTSDVIPVGESTSVSIVTGSLSNSTSRGGASHFSLVRRCDKPSN